MNKLRRLLKTYFYEKSLQYQLQVTYLLIVIIPFAIFGLMFYSESESALKKEAEKNNHLLMESVSKNIDSFFREVAKESSIYASLVLETNTMHPDLLNRENNNMTTWSYENKYLLDIFDLHEFISIRAFSNNGEQLGISVNPDNNKAYGYNSREEMNWQKLIKNNFSHEVMFDIHPLEPNGIYALTASRAIFDPQTNRKIGYISFDKEISSFTINFKQIEYRTGGEVQIIKEDGTLFYHSNFALIGKRADEKLLEHIRAISANTITDEINGEPIIMTYNKLREQNLTVVGSIPLKELTKDISGLGHMTIYTTLFLIVLISILSYLLSVYLTNPIKMLMKQMSLVERGTLKIDKRIPETNIEISQLSKSFYSMIDRINQLITIQYQTELHKKDAELKALIMQINPHFLYNTLEVISGIADEEGVEPISDITQSLSKMLRYSIGLDRELVTVEEELEHCKHYLLILKSRFEDELQMEYHFDPAAYPCLMMKMTLQPLIENAIRHGIESKPGRGRLGIRVERNGDMVEIDIADNGVGFDERKLHELRAFMADAANSFNRTTTSTHLGLKNVYTRLSLLFGERLDFRIDSVKGEGTTIRIRFPAITNQQGSG